MIDVTVFASIQAAINDLASLEIDVQRVGQVLADNDHASLTLQNGENTFSIRISWPEKDKFRCRTRLDSDLVVPGVTQALANRGWEQAGRSWIFFATCEKSDNQQTDFLTIIAKVTREILHVLCALDDGIRTTIEVLELKD